MSREFSSWILAAIALTAVVLSATGCGGTVDREPSAAEQTAAAVAGLSPEQVSFDAGAAEPGATGLCEARPAVPLDTSVPTPNGIPAHIRCTWQGDQPDDSVPPDPRQRQILIIPVEQYIEVYSPSSDMDSGVSLVAEGTTETEQIPIPTEAQTGEAEIVTRLDSLKMVVESKPDTALLPIPVVPLLGDTKQLFGVHKQFLDFTTGSGLSFVTHDGRNPLPVTNEDLYFVFQGLTPDDEYVVAMFYPVTTVDVLPDNREDVSPKEARWPATDPEVQRMKMFNTLGRLDPSTDFAPSLGALRDVVTSITIATQE